MPTTEQIVSRHDVGRIFLREHDPDAVWMLANDYLFEFVVIWSIDTLSIKCLYVVCLLACLLEYIGQPALFSLTADHASDKAERGGQISTITPYVLTCELGVAFQKVILVLGLREKVRGVPWLRNFPQSRRCAIRTGIRLETGTTSGCEIGRAHV